MSIIVALFASIFLVILTIFTCKCHGDIIFPFFNEKNVEERKIPSYSMLMWNYQVKIQVNISVVYIQYI